MKFFLFLFLFNAFTPSNEPGFRDFQYFHRNSKVQERDVPYGSDGTSDTTKWIGRQHQL